MTDKTTRWEMLSILFKAHPWHGVPIGDQQPEMVNVYIELVPQDTVKYELDKHSGHLMVDRPQAFSNICPTLYGFIPQTLCADQVADFCMQHTGRTGIAGDGDPMDICVLSEKNFPRGDILLHAYPIGGLRMLDGNEADDKIVAVLKNDAVYGHWRSIQDVPRGVIDRLQHYFLTYKHAPGRESPPTEITHVYDRDDAHEVIRRSWADYLAAFGDMDRVLSLALGA